LASRTAHADPIPLRYEVPDGCPTRAEYVAAVTARGASFERRKANADSSFEVDIEQRVDGFHAELAVRNGNITSRPREVQAVSCAEVVDALAAVTAIALNPPTDGDTLLKPPVLTEAKPANAKPERPALSGSGDVWSKTLDVEAGQLHLDHALAITAFVGPTLGLVPGRVLPRLEVGVSRANFVTAPGGQSYLIGSIARLHADLLFDENYRFGDFKTDVGGQEIGASLCFSPHYDNAGWALLGCADISAGFVGIRSKDASSRTTQDKNQGYGGVGLGLEASYNLGSHLQIGLRVNAQALTSAITAERPDGTRLFSSSPIIGTGMLGVGTHF
jgi:hypothetical protein